MNVLYDCCVLDWGEEGWAELGSGVWQLYMVEGNLDKAFHHIQFAVEKW